MTDDAAHELQVAIVSCLKADAAVSALVQGRIYDHVPMGQTGATAVFPYIAFGPSQDIPADIDCLDASEILLQLDVWSRDPGFMEGRAIAKAMRRALTEDALALTDNALVYFVFSGRQDVRAPDGLTTQIVSRFRAGVEHN